jgi:predicted GNAT superfamily acetyltransferase
VAGGETVIEIRWLCTHAEFSEAVDLQQKIWEFPDRDLFPERMFVVVSKTGGHILGAYRGKELVGFCLAMPGFKPDGLPYWHSHMLAVLPEYRNSGVGRRMKLQQREEALRRGLELIEWTFNPLEVKNAFFNIERLGAIVRRYVENQYGPSSSPLDGGLPTDRCIAEWWITNPRVVSALEGRRTAHQSEERVTVPVDIARLRQEEPERAREIQRSNAARFQEYFMRGLAVTGFERTPSEGVYLLEPWE